MLRFGPIRIQLLANGLSFLPCSHPPWSSAEGTVATKWTLGDASVGSVVADSPDQRLELPHDEPPVGADRALTSKNKKEQGHSAIPAVFSGF